MIEQAIVVTCGDALVFDRGPEAESASKTPRSQSPFGRRNHDGGVPIRVYGRRPPDSARRYRCVSCRGRRRRLRRRRRRGALPHRRRRRRSARNVPRRVRNTNSIRSRTPSISSRMRRLLHRRVGERPVGRPDDARSHGICSGPSASGGTWTRKICGYLVGTP